MEEIHTCNKETLHNALAEIKVLEKLVDDFDGAVRYLMTVSPQLENILKRNTDRIKE